MTNYRFRKSLLVAIALSGAVINAFYAIGIVESIFSSQYNSDIKEIMISAAALEIGWITLLVWVILNPFERRHILLFTIVPILLGNILHGVNQLGTHSENLMAIALNTIFGLFYSGLYIVAFMAGKKNNMV
jgi:predicted MFS family arabinose efflux permease